MQSKNIKMIIHKFSECDKPRIAWQWVMTFTHNIKSLTHIDKQWKGSKMEHCLFKNKLPKRIECFQPIQILLCSITMWHIWFERDNLAFNGKQWFEMQIGRMIWDGLIDYGGLEWQHVLANIKKQFEVEHLMLHEFARLWCPHHTICKFHTT